MHDTPATILNAVAADRDLMCRRLVDWANINSHSHHVAGLERLADAVGAACEPLGGSINRLKVPPAKVLDRRGQWREVPLGPVVSVLKRPDRPRRVLLNIHLDTVFPADGPFQLVHQPDPNTLNGPGVADAKGGLVVLLAALTALERTPAADRIGWEVLLNSDEEIGSPGSAPLLTEAASRSRLAMVFEPALPDGSVVGTRKGSGNFTLLARGRAAHAGRDFHAGRSAVLAMAELVHRIDALHATLPREVTLNVGQFHGGEAANIVPDLAWARVNARVTDADQQHLVERSIAAALESVAQREGIRVEVHGGFSAPPLQMTRDRQVHYDRLIRCGSELGMTVTVGPSGGASDGNKLAATGIPVLDGLGVRGGSLHSEREFAVIDSLVERATLAALFLVRWAQEG